MTKLESLLVTDNKALQTRRRLVPGQSWGDSNHSMGSVWHAWSHGSTQRWQNCTWHHQFQGKHPRLGPCRRWGWFSRPGRVQHAQLGTHRAGRPDPALGPGANAPIRQAWAGAESIGPLHTAGCSPGGNGLECCQKVYNSKDDKASNKKMQGETEAFFSLFGPFHMPFLKPSQCENDLRLNLSLCLF